MERTLVIIKPDAIQRRLAGEIIHRFERRGLRIIAMKMIKIGRPLAEEHYAEHQGKPFYDPLIGYITAAPVVVMILEGYRAISAVRRMLGATNPSEAEPGTIRADYAMQTRYNLVHGSDGLDTAKREIALFFSPDEIVSQPRPTDPFVFE
ncbi:MAG: nucleoside-diphosphate kinase [Anaerolineae bacterium]|nr:nucleoside-diphosphate kinase [Anaerolineae bacterium]